MVFGALEFELLKNLLKFLGSLHSLPFSPKFLPDMVQSGPIANNVLYNLN